MALAKVRPELPGNRTSEYPVMTTHDHILRAVDVDRYG